MVLIFCFIMLPGIIGLLVVSLLSKLVRLFEESFLKCSLEVGFCFVGFEFVVCSEYAPTCLTFQMLDCVKEDWGLAKNPVVETLEVCF